jgi:hypothetical protein
MRMEAPYLHPPLWLTTPLPALGNHAKHVTYCSAVLRLGGMDYLFCSPKYAAPPRLSTRHTCSAARESALRHMNDELHGRGGWGDASLTASNASLSLR